MMTLLENPTYGMEVARDAAFERLVALLLTSNELERRILPSAADAFAEKALGRLARLRAARAVYAMNSNGELTRENEGAWMLRHAA